jgi:copper chaperone CopZ
MMKNIMNWLSAITLIMAFSLSTFAGEPNQAKVNLNVKGMKCGGCEAKVKNVLGDMEGVVSTEEVSSAKGSVMLTIDKTKTSEKAVAAALADKTGYDVTVVADGAAVEVKGNEKAACCSKGQTKAACESKKK